MQKELNKTEIQHFIETCKQHHLRVTPQRIAIYQATQESGHHPSADDIFKQILPDYPNITYDTVNRTLLTFARIQLVQIVESFTGVRRFDPHFHPHHHVHCIKCGKIEDFYQDWHLPNIPAGIQKRFQILSQRVVISGICRECAGQS